MARVQIVPLPTVKADGYEHTPFILILDKLDNPLTADELSHLRKTTGAQLVISTGDEWEAPGQLELTEEQRETLLTHLTQPTRLLLNDWHDAQGVVDIRYDGTPNLITIPADELPKHAG